MKIPELLAPVGHMEALKAAVFAGADAVYLGGKEFNARMNADNFSREELIEAVKYCHIFEVNIYITINILLKDKEIKQVIDYIYFLYDIGVDALIIQDLGLFFLLNKIFKELPIHSSTQMFVHSLYGVKLLEELGFERIVLARELTANEVKYIVDHTNKEIKIFNHGAMCLCYSGQCLMSSMIGGRSGNRGCCAQPCRKTYELWSENNQIDKGHLLSPKDLNTLDRVSSLINTGAHSLKIEGRKKSAEYVYTVVSAYRKLIDASYIGDKVSLSARELLDVEQVFNRKFTSGYLFTEKLTQEELIIKDNPRKRGVLVGEVISIKGNMSCIKLTNHITLGDGLLVLGKNTEYGETLNELYDEYGKEIEHGSTGEKVIVSLRKSVHNGDKVYKTSDSTITSNLKELLNKEFPRIIPIKMNVSLRIGEVIKAQAQWKENRFEFSGTKIVEKAKNKPLEIKRIQDQFSKLGNTPFKLSEISVELDENAIVSISELNEVRRALIEKITDKIIKVDRPIIEVKNISQALEIKPIIKSVLKNKLVVNTSRIDLLPYIAGSNADEIIFGGDIEFDIILYAKAVEICKKHNKSIMLSFPSVTRNKYIENLLKYIKQIKCIEPNGVLIGNYEILSIFRKTGLRLESDYKFNAFNRFALLQLEELGFESAYLPLELNQNEINIIVKNRNIDIGLCVHGNTELMVTEYSLLKEPGKIGYLKDKLEFQFPVYTDFMNRTHIYNGKKLSLYDEIDKIENVSKYRIDITTEEVDEVLYTIEGYSDRLRANYKNYEGLTTKNSNITKGHYKRGVL
ncbi:hypothetical protein GC105_11035 [Alkalibaculum sp. M08DMB]|uniref:Peptidase U32 collagenase domain-containing protein n=1 Tax=Alkalibaculum sporogenes TaxID=2655001 RepID=A0A6A7KBE0_9FIRM|nr:U32 family peptidase [Alkalibaculum sporogenes]MPW26323.1 hypothetical protein [Alkalibaculum sporogenes]